MHADTARELLLSQPHTSEETPFGPDVLVYKVGGKMFATLAFEGDSPRTNLKCDPERSLELRASYEDIVPGYHMNKKHWNTLALDGALPDNLVSELIEHSYELVFASLTKKQKADL